MVTATSTLPHILMGKGGEANGMTVLGHSRKQTHRGESVGNSGRKLLPVWVTESVFESEAFPFVEGLLGVTSLSLGTFLGYLI